MPLIEVEEDIKKAPVVTVNDAEASKQGADEDSEFEYESEDDKDNKEDEKIVSVD